VSIPQGSLLNIGHGISTTTVRGTPDSTAHAGGNRLRLAATRLASIDPHTRLYALPAWGILVIRSEEKTIIARKGRKQRITPLTKQTVAVLRVWLAERSGRPDQPLFPSRTGGPLSRDAIEHRIAKHVGTATQACASLQAKTITAHVLRHTAAMRLLHAGVDTSVIALWLGHEQIETTQIYLHADMALKEAALARTTPPNTPPGRYHPPDTLLAFLEAI